MLHASVAETAQRTSAGRRRAVPLSGQRIVPSRPLTPVRVHFFLRAAGPRRALPMQTAGFAFDVRADRRMQRWAHAERDPGLLGGRAWGEKKKKGEKN